MFVAVVTGEDADGAGEDVGLELDGAVEEEEEEEEEEGEDIDVDAPRD